MHESTLLLPLGQAALQPSLWLVRVQFLACEMVRATPVLSLNNPVPKHQRKPRM
jgi:hypothetical protein